MGKKIEIDENGSFSGIAEEISNLQKGDYTKGTGTHNQTDCSGTNRGDCTNSGDCSQSTNNNVCSNSGTCDTWSIQ